MTDDKPGTADEDVDALGVLAGMEDAIRDALAELKAQGTEVTSEVMEQVTEEVIERLKREHPDTD